MEVWSGEFVFFTNLCGYCKLFSILSILQAVIHPNVVDGDRECGFMGLVFGGADLFASSVVIPPDTTSVSDIEKIIIQVRRHTRLHLFMGTRKQFCFLFLFLFPSCNL